MAFKPIILINGLVIEIQQNLLVRSLIDAQYEWRSGSFVKIRKGDICLVRHEPYQQLTLGKATQYRNFRDVKPNVQENVDFELIDGEIPYPPKTVYAPLDFDFLF